MADEPKLSKIEILKDHSRQLRGTMGEELRAEIDHFCPDSEQLLKPHGIYQQENKDTRKLKAADGTKIKQFSITDQASAGRAKQELLAAAGGKLIVDSVERKQRKRNPAAPFTTSVVTRKYPTTFFTGRRKLDAIFYFVKLLH